MRDGRIFSEREGCEGPVNNGIAEAMAREGSAGGKRYIVRVRVGRTK